MFAATPLFQTLTGGQHENHMRDYLKGEKSAIPAGKQVFIPTLVVKKDTVEEFTQKINQLRGR